MELKLTELQKSCASITWKTYYRGMLIVSDKGDLHVNQSRK